MAFRPVQYDSGKLVKVKCATSQAITKGAALSNADGTGYYTLVSAGDGITPTHVAMETVTTSANGQEVLAIRTPGVIFEADCDAAPAQAEIGTFVDLASATQLDSDATADDIFFIEDVVGKVGTSTVVRGWFMLAAPNA